MGREVLGSKTRTVYAGRVFIFFGSFQSDVLEAGDGRLPSIWKLEATLGTLLWGGD